MLIHINEKKLLGIFALTLISSGSFADSGKRNKKAKAKVVCIKTFPDTKDCYKNEKMHL